MSNQFSAPVLVRQDGTSEPFKRLKLGKGGSYSERDLQNLLFDFPGLLPSEEIDPAFSSLLPVCTVKWSQETGQLAKVYPKPLKGYENGEAPEV